MDNHYLDIRNLFKKYFDRIPDCDEIRDDDDFWGIKKIITSNFNNNENMYYVFEEEIGTENNESFSYRGFVVKPKEGESFGVDDLLKISNETRKKIEELWRFKGDYGVPSEIIHAVNTQENGWVHSVERLSIDRDGKIKDQTYGIRQTDEKDISYEEYVKRATEILEDLFPSKELGRPEDID